MATFIASVKRDVEGKMTRKGHGVKHCVHGSLDRGSPWFHPDDSLHSKGPDLHAHWRRPVFVCIWEFLDPSIKAPPCPFCESSEHVVSDGWDPQSRTVHGQHYNFEMIGKQHRCTNCKRRSEKSEAKRGSTGVRYKFAAWNPGVLRLLRRDLQELFPAVILRRPAVAVELITRIEQTLVSSMGLATLANDVRENYLKYHMKMQLRYYARIARIKSRKQQSLLAKENELLKNSPLFGDFDDETGYNGRPPSAAVLQSA